MFAVCLRLNSGVRIGALFTHSLYVWKKRAE